MKNEALVCFYFIDCYLLMFNLLIIPFLSTRSHFSVFWSPFWRHFSSFSLATVFQPRFSVFLSPLKPHERRELQK
jgi:hypothetical protein